MNRLENALQEANLARTWEHMQNHDCGTITGFRSYRHDNDGYPMFEYPYTRAEKTKRNYSLQAKLQAKRYGITKMSGIYIESYGSPDAKEVHEDIFFVVDLQDKGSLESDLRALGEEFDQDSILFIPKGGEGAVLCGTNKLKDSEGNPTYPGYGKSKKFNHRQFGKDGEFFTKVSGRPFVFTEGIEMKQMSLPEGYFGRWGCHAIANSRWQDLDI